VDLFLTAGEFVAQAQGGNGCVDIVWTGETLCIAGPRSHAE
jgi:hypothetical protein